MRPFITGYFILFLALNGFGQTVFIPDLQFRDVLNNWAPGLVDAAGNMPLNNTGMHPDEFVLQVNWTPADLAGIEALENLSDLTISCDAGVNLSLASIGQSGHLTLIDLPLPALPSIVYAEQITLHRAPLMTAFPLINVPGLVFLEFDSLVALQSTPIIPDGVQQLNLRAYPAAIPMPLLPQSLFMFRCKATDHTSLPNPFPDYMDVIELDSMPNLTLLPAPLPPVFLQITIARTGLTSIDIGPGGNASLQLNDNLALQTLQSASLIGQCMIENCFALTNVILDGSSNGQGWMQIDGTPVLESLAFGTGWMHIQVQTNSTLASISEFPPELQELQLHGSVLQSLPLFPEGLLYVTVMDTTLIELPTLPSTLIELNINGSNQVATLPTLPTGLQTLDISGTQIACLPGLPDGLQVLQLDNTNVDCMPNHPPAIPQLFPLCTILNTSCPEYAPYISGHVFRDGDGNGVQDLGEPDLFNATITASPSGYMTGTDSVGNYLTALPLGTHTITVQAVQPYVLGSLPAEYNIQLPDQDTIITDLDFGIQMDTLVVDTRVQITAYSMVRPGYDQFFQLQVDNYGPTAYDVEVILEYDPVLVATGGFPLPQIEPTELVWLVDSIPAGGQVLFFGEFYTPVTTPIGYQFGMIARVLPIHLQDINPNNNTFWIPVTVVSSFDPERQTRHATFSNSGRSCYRANGTIPCSFSEYRNIPSGSRVDHGYTERRP